MNEMDEASLADMEAISVYSRADALEDGELVEADQALQRQAGVAFPVAYTHSVYADCIEWTALDAQYHGALQDAAGREWDVLMSLRSAIRRAGDASQVTFAVSRVPRDGSSPEPTEVTMHAVCGPGDAGEPVITVVSSLSEL